MHALHLPLCFYSQDCRQHLHACYITVTQCSLVQQNSLATYLCRLSQPRRHAKPLFAADSHVFHTVISTMFHRRHTRKGSSCKPRRVRRTNCYFFTGDGEIDSATTLADTSFVHANRILTCTTLTRSRYRAGWNDLRTATATQSRTERAADGGLRALVQRVEQNNMQRAPCEPDPTTWPSQHCEAIQQRQLLTPNLLQHVNYMWSPPP